MKIESILVPTDFSETANHATEQAVEIAIRYHAKLHLFNVIEPFVDASKGLASSVRDYLERLERDAEEALAMKMDVIRGNDIDVTYTTSRNVSAFEGIRDKIGELEPDLVVVGTHGRTGLKRIVMGSVAEKLLRHVPVNVLTARKSAAVARAADGFSRILVPVDFSDWSRKALAAARTLLPKGGELFVVHVVASPVHPSFYAGGLTQLFQVDPGLPGRVRESIEGWLDAPVDDIIVTEGDIPTEILDAATNNACQLVVMGARGLSALDRFLLGRVTEHVVRRSEAPVLTVH